MLTKSDFIKHEECPIWLWLVKNRPDLLPEPSPGLQRIFDSGSQVDQLAKSLFPGGVEIEGYNKQGWENTQKVIATDASAPRADAVFQPTVYTPDGLSARADILTRDASTGVWDLREVKMTTSVKPEHIIDVAFQRICFEGSGVPIGKTFLVHLNNEYVRQGKIEPEKLFVSEDITEDVLAAMDATRAQIEEAKKVIGGVETVDELLVHRCDTPKKCEYLGYYIHGLPEVYDIIDKFSEDHLKALLDRGILDSARIAPDVLEKIGYQAEVPFTSIDKEGIRTELAKMEYPLCFFDYETYAAAIPLFDGTRPYQQMPFQYSLDIRETPGGPIVHKEFLARSYENPMPALLEQLKKDMPTDGMVIAWHASFEKGRNDEMGEMYPEYREFLISVNDRMYDLMLLFKGKNGKYLDSQFRKSASLKSVLPVICPELAYSDLVIQEGGEASAGWPALTNPTTPEPEREELARNMLAYCQRDTAAMVCILDKVATQAMDI